MDIVGGLSFVLFAMLVAVWILSALAKRHVVVHTVLPPDQVMAGTLAVPVSGSSSALAASPASGEDR